MKKQRFKKQFELAWLWLKKFDIKPAKPVIDQLLIDADLAFANNNVDQSTKILQKIIKMCPSHHLVLQELAIRYLRSARYAQAKNILRQAIKHHPDYADFYYYLGKAYARTGQYRMSAKFLQRSLLLCPEDVASQHILDAVQKRHTKIAPRKYIVDMFDHYADIFEESLVDCLDYQVPKKLAAYLNDYLPVCQLDRVLDLGCGTGLLGKQLTGSYSIKELIGVDLSANMLEKSREKEVYSTLSQLDLYEYLCNSDYKFDLIAAADVFVYIGDLDDIFAKVYEKLSLRGYFMFSVEAKAGPGFELTCTGRYKHSLKYVTSLYNKHQYSRIYTQATGLRMQDGKMVAGYLVLLQK